MDSKQTHPTWKCVFCKRRQTEEAFAIIQIHTTAWETRRTCIESITHRQDIHTHTHTHVFVCVCVWVSGWYLHILYKNLYYKTRWTAEFLKPIQQNCTHTHVHARYRLGYFLWCMCTLAIPRMRIGGVPWSGFILNSENQHNNRFEHFCDQEMWCDGPWYLLVCRQMGKG